MPVAELEAAFHCPAKCPVKYHMVAHQSATFSCCNQYFLFDPPHHSLAHFPVVCLTFVLVKISLYFVVKYSVGVTYISSSWLNSPPYWQRLLRNQPLAPIFPIFVEHQVIGAIP